MAYYFSKVLETKNFDEAIHQVTAELKKEGFGVLNEIDLQSTLKKKIDADINRYKILGACNPEFAYKAVQQEENIGVFLPCNVVVKEQSNGSIEVSAVDPLASMVSVENEALGEVAIVIQDKLKRFIDHLS